MNMGGGPGNPQRGPGDRQGGQRFLGMSLGSPKASPERWDSERLGIPWLAGWAGLVGLARWKAPWAAKTWLGSHAQIIFEIYHT